MTKRAYCTTCHYPLKTCLCEFVSAVTSRHQIIIMQHPSEVSQAKGTAKLVDLSMTQASIVVGETASNFAPLKQQIEQQLEQKIQPYYLVYPQPHRQAVETIGKSLPDSTLIFLDGSWAKAYKILQLNPWLLQLPALTFEQAPKTAYKIRKAPRSDSLSTIESVAYCLDHLDNTDTSGLTTLFKAMIDGQWRFMNNDVKKRY
jgi:DTW domain-containing protein YfiP